MLGSLSGESNLRKDLCDDFARVILELLKKSEIDKENLHGAKLFNKIWVWLITGGTWHDLRSFSGNGTFILLCEYEQECDIPLDKVDWNDVDAVANELSVHSALRANKERFKKDIYGGFEWFIPPKTNIGKELSLDKARFALSIFAQLKSTEETPNSIWARCFKESNTDKLILGLSRLNARCVVHKVTRIGSLSHAAQNKIKGSLPSFDTLVQTYKTFLNNAKLGAQNDFEALIESQYDPLTEFRTKPQKTTPSSISINTSWSGTYHTLSLPPPSARISIKVRITPGQKDPEPHAKSLALRKEIGYLYGLSALCGKNDFCDDYEVVNFSANSGREVTDADVEKFISSAELNKPDFGNESPVEGVVRKNMDFCEKLWVFCQRCKSIQDLISVFTLVCKKLKSGNFLPFVDKTNKTTFASVVRDVYKLNRLKTSAERENLKRHALSKFTEWIISPAEVLMEIGMYKILGDFYNCLICKRFYILCPNLKASRLTAFDNLASFFDSSFPVELKMMNIRCLFHIVESWSLVVNHIVPMPHDWQKTLVNALVARTTLLLATAKRSTLSTRFTNLQRILGETVFYSINLPRFSIESACSFEKIISEPQNTRKTSLQNNYPEEFPKMSFIFDRTNTIFQEINEPIISEIESLGLEYPGAGRISNSNLTLIEYTSY